MAAKATMVVMFSLVLFLIVGSNTVVMAHPKLDAEAATAAKAGGTAAGGASPVGAADATYKDESGVMGAGLGAGAPAK